MNEQNRGTGRTVSQILNLLNMQLKDQQNCFYVVQHTQHEAERACRKYRQVLSSLGIHITMATRSSVSFIDTRIGKAGVTVEAKFLSATEFYTDKYQEDSLKSWVVVVD